MNSVLVLLAAHNGGAWLRPQVESILDQTLENISVIIGDDCSTDSSVCELKSKKLDGRLQFVMFSEPSGGAGQSFFRLLSEVDLGDFEFVAFSDQDDVWNPDKLERAVVMLRHYHADGYSAAVTAFWPSGKERVLSQDPSLTDIDFLFEGAGQGCTFVLRGDFIRSLQKIIQSKRPLLLGIHYHDWAIYALSRVLGGQWVFDSEPSMRYRQHGGNDTGARGAIEGVKKRLGLIKNGWYCAQVQEMIRLVLSLDLRNYSLPEDFSSVWGLKPGLLRRVRLSIILFRRGRRRPFDRVVLTASALLGWL